MLAKSGDKIKPTLQEATTITIKSPKTGKFSAPSILL